jgi:hypothetical protein
MAEPKEKTAGILREPKAKHKLGLKVPTALRLPHDDLIKPTLPSQTSQSTQTTPASHTSQTRQGDNQPGAAAEVSPRRDFTKVPNSVAREVIPAGEFKGKSSQLYQCLYSMTRGAIVPKRAVRISRPRLMKLAGIGARVTFDSNITHLCTIGLLQVRQITGEHEGNEYTVLLPEERIPDSMASLTSQSSQTSHAHKVDGLVSLETSLSSQGANVDSVDSSGSSKTSFKTNTERSDDDEAFAALREVERELTGRSAGANQWREVAEVLATELRIAAARTTVSSVPAFLAEHLRRRLFKKDRRQLAAEEASAPAASPLPAGVDVKTCPDCQGSGYYYPEGFEKGVARCQHAGLRKAEG